MQEVPFAGEGFVVPKVGDIVEIVQGRNVGRLVKVVGTSGNVFNLAVKIHVELDGREVWYWPWNLRPTGG